MKKLLLLFIVLILTQTCSIGETIVTKHKKFLFLTIDYFGLKNDNDELVIDVKYKKLIKLGNNAWIIQNKKNKFGIIDYSDNCLVEPKYSQIQRYSEKYVTLGNNKDFGLYDEFGKTVIPAEFNSIKPIFGDKFLTLKKNKYGVYSASGEKLLDNYYDYIFMSSPDKLSVRYDGKWININVDENNNNIKNLQSELLTPKKVQAQEDIHLNLGARTGYSILTATDYTLKALSSISTSYEDTIEELMLSQGLDSVSIFIKMSWIPRFPIVYIKNYGKNVIQPTNGAISNIRSDLKNNRKYYHYNPNRKQQIETENAINKTIKK